MAFFGFEDLFGGGGGHPFGGEGMGMPEAKKGDVDALYKTLQLEKGATTTQVKKAFMKLARVHHPDKGGDPEKFKELQHAYDILRDDEKRDLFAKYGSEGLDPQMVARRKRAQPKGESTRFPIKVPLEQFYRGATRKLRITKKVICGQCDGEGGSEVETCKQCSGRGMVIRNRQLGPGMIQRVQMRCDKCKGRGQSIPFGKGCKPCNGNGTKTEQKTLEVYIAKGMQHKEEIKFEEEGDQQPGTTPGDIVVVLEQQSHDFFKRSADGPHLVMTKHISLAEALTGFSFKITHLDGRILQISSQPGEIVKPGDVKAILEEGMPVARSHNMNGHLYIEIKIDFPEAGQLDAKAQELIKQILPGPGRDNKSVFKYTPKTKVAPEDAPSTVPEKHLLTDIDIQAEKRKYAQHMRNNRHDDDDDDEGMHGGQPVRCANQ